MQKYSYFDDAATTQISKHSLDEYTSTALNYIGNPSSTHSLGREAKAKLEEAREDIAKCLNIKAKQLFFTSGATESIAIVISSLLWAKTPGEVIFSQIEHEALLSWKQILIEKGWTVKTIKAKGGFVNPKELEDMISERTKLIAIQLVSNVTGAIQDIKSLVSVTREKEKEYGKKIFFFTDAVQALGKVPFSLTELDVDGASFSSHKIAGPRGIGALYLKKAAIQVLAKGGGQESGVRGGTENLPAIRAFAVALKDAMKKDDHILSIYNKVRDILQSGDIKIISPSENTSPFILSITTPLPSEVMTRMLKDRNYCVSSGSACSNNAKGKAEDVILAMGFTPKEAMGVIRISFFHTSEEEEAIKLANEIVNIVKDFK